MKRNRCFRKRMASLSHCYTGGRFQGSGAPNKGRAGGDATTGIGAAHGHIAEPALQSVKAIKKQPTPPNNPPPENKNKDKIHGGGGGGSAPPRAATAARLGGDEI
jgi:hypothetical protein